MRLHAIAGERGVTESALLKKFVDVALLQSAGALDSSASRQVDAIPRNARLFVRLRPDDHVLVDVGIAEAVQGLFSWWASLTGSGGEGIVVKPKDFIARGARGILQPAIKSRGAEYLRIIYGPEYSRPDALERLRTRSLATKRSMALREFALGIEGLEGFIQRRVHECVFGVLAMESEPVDPRL